MELLMLEFVFPLSCFFGKKIRFYMDLEIKVIIKCKYWRKDYNTWSEKWEKNECNCCCCFTISLPEEDVFIYLLNVVTLWDFATLFSSRIRTQGILTLTQMLKFFSSGTFSHICPNHKSQYAELSKVAIRKC